MNSFTTHFWIGFGGGIASFAHCIGMCGGFVLHLSGSRQSAGTLPLQALWHLARIATYSLTGTVAGLAGQSLLTTAAALPRLQNVLAWLAGGMMIAAGLSLLGILPARLRHPLSPGFLFDMAGKLADSAPPPARAIFLGILTGLLPCPLILAVLCYAVQTGSPSAGFYSMAAMGCGTLVPLLLVHVAGRWIQLREWSSIAGAVILILLGSGTVLRGSGWYHLLLGCPPPAVSPAVGTTVPPLSTPLPANHVSRPPSGNR